MFAGVMTAGETKVFRILKISPSLQLYVAMNVSSTNTTKKIQLCLTTISYVRESLSSFYTFNLILACVVNGILSIIGTLVNGLVLAAFWKSSFLRSKTPFFLIMLLSLNDFLVVIIVHPLFLYNSIKQLVGEGECVAKAVYLTIAKLLTGYSGLTLHIMNIERYFSIAHPFWYQRRVTPRTVLAAVVLSWVLWTPISFASFIDSSLHQTLLSICSAIVCITIMLVYGRIFQIARKKRRATPSPSIIDLTIREISVPELSNVKATQRSQRPNKLNEMIKDIKLAKMFIILVVCSQICYLPNLAYHIHLRMQDTELKTESLLIMGNWVVTFISMNSTLNSLVFFWRNSQLRNEMLQIIKNV